MQPKGLRLAQYLRLVMADGRKFVFGCEGSSPSGATQFAQAMHRLATKSIHYINYIYPLHYLLVKVIVLKLQ